MRIVLERRHTKAGREGYNVARLEEGPHGGYAVEWKSVTDPTEFEALARHFGWNEEIEDDGYCGVCGVEHLDGDCPQVRKFLESKIGEAIEDPGYFATEKKKRK